MHPELFSFHFLSKDIVVMAYSFFYTMAILFVIIGSYISVTKNGFSRKKALGMLSLLTLAGLTVLGAQAEAQIRLTVRHLIAADATKQEIAEAIAQMGMFAGVPAMTKAMELANEVLEKDESA